MCSLVLVMTGLCLYTNQHRVLNSLHERHTVVLSSKQDILGVGQAVYIVEGARESIRDRRHCHNGREELCWSHLECVIWPRGDELMEAASVYRM